MSRNLTCSRGHANLLSSRFCQDCGERLVVVSRDHASETALIRDRYRILRALGRGGFGQTYLIEDIHRFGEHCVLKEFDPLELDLESLPKAKELFEREAQVLYQLRHPQIPQFREWFMDPERHSLCLVQDYIEGATYLELLSQRLQKGRCFTEAEVLHLLTHVLPILDYIHGQGVIHRDISPDNLICRQSDQLPQLIDFGGVKQVSAHLSQLQRGGKVSGTTLIGKPGYAPIDQLRWGQVSAPCDLYALGVTALVLLVGKDPQTFFDPNTQALKLPQGVQLSPGLVSVLEKLVATHASERYASARSALADLEAIPTDSRGAAEVEAGSFPSQLGSPTPLTQVIHQPSAPLPLKLGARLLSRSAQLASRLSLKGAILLTIGVASYAGWSLMRSWLSTNPLSAPLSASSSEVEEDAPAFSPEEQARKERLFQQIDSLQMSSGLFNRLVNEAFYLQYPNLQGRRLSNVAADAQERANWDAVAFQVLEILESLTPDARDRLGTYSRTDLETWENQLKATRVNPRRLYRDAERDVVRQLPMYRRQDLPKHLAHQLWYATVADRVTQSLFETQAPIPILDQLIDVVNH
ncbi:protein kinase [Synechococcales cyanobacterium C]|uniref:non-specific serine/threonine protein kinase n=1 Tax=Petrachloros mirabilis ULC683 TaxID=2781853 RepID=A0A8K2A9L7_9CYAN|nr:serine/threonine-protein kinase [Petrachloros mirabilis]NCJ08394.1 protein kinase [Petrachloros mirabilis ULC683]